MFGAFRPEKMRGHLVGDRGTTGFWRSILSFGVDLGSVRKSKTLSIENRNDSTILNGRSDCVFIICQRKCPTNRPSSSWATPRSRPSKNRGGSVSFVEKSRTPTADSLRKLRRAINWQVLLVLRTSGDRLPAVFPPRSYRCSRFFSELGLEVLCNDRVADRKAVAPDK